MSNITYRTSFSLLINVSFLFVLLIRNKHKITLQGNENVIYPTLNAGTCQEF